MSFFFHFFFPMAENKENEIDLIVQVIDSAINIKVTRQRSTDVVQNSIIFQANAHLRNRLGAGAQALIRSSGLVGFQPAGEYSRNLGNADHK